MISIVKRTAVIIVLLLLASCSGGSGDVAGIDRGGIRGGIAVGAVTGFGSIFVNGVRYTTDLASVEIDGQPAASDDLELGYVVRVEAEFSDAGGDPAALRVSFDSDAAGPVDSVDASAGRLVVLGQQLATDNATYFGPGIDPTSFAGLQPGDLVRVSGFRDPDGQILAARIELAPGLTAQRVRGFAAAVDTNADRLSIGGLEIDYSGASVVDGFPQGEPRNGDPLRAIGTRDPGTGLFVATQLVYLSSMLDVEEGDEGEIEGFVTRFVSATDFDVTGIPVTTNAQTEFEDGQADDLAVGVRVEVEGEFDASSVLVARELEFKFTASARIEGTVTDVDPTAGTLQVLGIEVSVAGLTNLNNLGAGDCVKLGGRETAAGFVVQRYEDEDDCDSSRVRGIATQVADPQLRLLGVLVSTDGGTNFPGGAGSFFAAAPGRLVEARGDADGPGLLAAELEFKD